MPHELTLLQGGAAAAVDVIGAAVGNVAVAVKPETSMRRDHGCNGHIAARQGQDAGLRG